MRCLVPLILLAVSSVGGAAVRLPKILSSHAVLQRGVPIHLWGWSDPDETVTAMFENSSTSTKADHSGHWSLSMPSHVAGGPYQIKINDIILDDLLIGDVWFASGQSNMEMPLKGFADAPVKNGAQELSAATNPNLRLLLVPRKASAYPLPDFDGAAEWTACTPQTAATFSAAAYFFGREIAEREHVPIGLIDSTWGGTPAEAWVSMDRLGTDASLLPVFGAYSLVRNEQAAQLESDAASKREDDAARAANKAVRPHPWHPDPDSWTPSWLYNAMVAPAIPYAIKGAIWYQGESNAGPERAPLYEKLFPALISDWRNHWNCGDFPFLFVQIAYFGTPSKDGWPTVRDAQRRTLTLANTGMAVTIDVGDLHNIHPPDKETVGSRLARAARAVAYGEKIDYSGPLFRSVSSIPNGLRVDFTGTSGQLISRGAVTGFEIAGPEHTFQPAEARIEGGSVLLINAQVAHPKYARYGWSGAPIVNLFDSAGLPASPFTSEETSAGKPMVF